MQALSIDHLVLTVADPGETERFYAALGMRAREFVGTDGTRRRTLVFGSQKINLHVAGSEFAPHAARPVPGSADLCLLVEGPMEDCLADLARAGIDVIEGPVARSGACGPILSVYARDPDGNLVELSVPA